MQVRHVCWARHATYPTHATRVKNRTCDVGHPDRPWDSHATTRTEATVSDVSDWVADLDGENRLR